MSWSKRGLPPESATILPTSPKACSTALRAASSLEHAPRGHGQKEGAISPESCVARCQGDSDLRKRELPAAGLGASWGRCGCNAAATVLLPACSSASFQLGVAGIGALPAQQNRDEAVRRARELRPGRASRAVGEPSGGRVESTRPFRVNSRTPLASRRARMRKPSCSIS